MKNFKRAGFNLLSRMYHNRKDIKEFILTLLSVLSILPFVYIGSVLWLLQ